MTDMTAADVRRVLTRRWPDDQYLHVYEAPLDWARMGTKIDVLVIALWRSKGHTVDAVEVKVSYGDWRKEIARTEWRVAGRPTAFDTKFRAEMSRHSQYDRVHACYGLPERHVVPNSTKSALWREHCDRFWIACPAPLAAKIAPELPERWGLIGCDERGTQCVVPALTNTRKPFSWQATIGIIRAAADSGGQALWRAEQRGFDRGCEFVRSELAEVTTP